MSTKNYLRVKLNGTDFPALKSIVLHFIQRVIWLWNLEPLIAFLTTWIKLVILDNEPTVTLNYDTQHFQQQAFIITGVKLFLLKHMSMKKAFSIDTKPLNLLITAAFTLF